MRSLNLFTIVLKHHQSHQQHVSDHLSTVTMKSPKWLDRIRRRSSYERQQQQVEEQHIAYDEEMQELANAYELALDELAYAIESQGSIYYDGDRETAQEAFDSCVDRYQFLMDRLSDAECIKLSALYCRALQDLHTQLSRLPCLY